MSIVIALKEKSIVYMASDTLACTDTGHSFYHFPKVWKTNNENIIIGGVGSARMVETVRFGFPYDYDTPSRDTIAAWILDIISKNEIKENDGFSFIVAGNGKAFVATNNGFVLEIDKYEAIGSGRDLAMGALTISEQMNLQPEERLHRVVQAVMTYDINVGGLIEINMI